MVNRLNYFWAHYTLKNEFIHDLIVGPKLVSQIIVILKAYMAFKRACPLVLLWEIEE